ncbi:sensor histidine kinase [Micromonospora sp. NPDC003197]
MDHPPRPELVRAGLVRASLVWLALAVAIGVELWGRWAELVVGLVLATTVLAAVVLVVGRRWPVWLLLLLGAAANLVQLVELSEFRFWPALVSAVACLTAGRRMANGLVALPCFSLVVLTGLLLAAVMGDVWDWFNVVLPLLGSGVLPWLIGRYVRLRADLAEAGWRHAEQLERERRLVVREVRLRERARIARDMHDSLGHELSLAAMRTGALELDRGLDERRRAAIGELRAVLVGATEQLRDIIGVLRDESEPVSTDPARESVAALVARSRASGMAVEFVSDGSEESTSTLAGRTVYRVVQEALTNAAKHAPGAPVTVRIEGSEAGTTITVVNGGPATRTPPAGAGGAKSAGAAGMPLASAAGAASTGAGGGHGLVGLRERVRLVGGTLHTGSSHSGEHRDGYTVVARIPSSGGPQPRTPTVDDEPESGRRLAQARRAALRGLASTVAVPVTIVAAVLLVLLGLRTGEVKNSWLDPAVYQALAVGQQRVELAAGLPLHQVDGRPDVPEPPSPPGATCEYYRVSDDLFAGPIDVYRLCFVDGRLVDKDFIPRTGS